MTTSHEKAEIPAQIPASSPAPLLRFPIQKPSSLFKIRYSILSPYPPPYDAKGLPSAPITAYYIIARTKNSLSSKPTLSYYRESENGPLIAEGRLHTWSSSVDLKYLQPDQPPRNVVLKHKSMWGRACEIEIADRRLVWKGTRGLRLLNNRDLKLIDEGSPNGSGQVNDAEIWAVLRVENGFCASFQGCFEIWKEELLGGRDEMEVRTRLGVLEECLISGMAMLHQEDQNSKAAAASA